MNAFLSSAFSLESGVQPLDRRPLLPRERNRVRGVDPLFAERKRAK